jgi:hypothetical protein
MMWSTAADSRRSGVSWPSSPSDHELRLDAGPGEGISFTEVVDDDSEAGMLACGDVRTRLDRRRPGIA